ncbi:hypothetical protein [Fusobacterium sp.]|jgi:hypothetical protein|uniref:hypothetical protein n=1 Tax=Fusobacterium sp. TaxID=68766 RepID=UPI001E02685E|nr:hypothetical protein [Fusobacterium sp.]MBS5790614.1 hypothetical protein [Fusobacterium sp.]
METKKTRKKRDLSSFIESEAQILERLRKMQENRKKYIFNMFKKIFTDILNDAELLEIIDKNKDNKEFQETLSIILKQEIQKYKDSEDKEISLEEENNEQFIK